MLTQQDLILIEGVVERVVERKLDEKLNVAFGAFEKKIDKKFEDFAIMVQREFSNIYKRFDSVDARFNDMDKRFDRLEVRVGTLEESMKLGLRILNLHNQRIESLESVTKTLQLAIA